MEVNTIPGLESKGAPALEGDYSTWTRKWNLTGLATTYRITEIVAYDESLDRLFLRTPDQQRFFILLLSNGSEVSAITINDYADPYTRLKAASTIRSKYFMYITSGILHIYKDNVDVKQIDLTAAPLNWGSGDIIWASISCDGKYIFIHDFDNNAAALFEGS